MEYIKEFYNMPFLKKGMRVKAIGKIGMTLRIVPHH